MPSIAGRILVAEDEPEVRGFLEVAFRCLGYDVDFAEDGEEALERYRNSPEAYSLILLDLMMPRKDGIETLREIRCYDSQIPVIILSSASSPLHVVDALKTGATDFLAKPITHQDLDKAIQKALREKAEPEPVVRTQATALPEACLTSSPWQRKLDMLLTQLSSCDVPVLILGETGVGKEVYSRQIHARSSRARKPFLKLNCAALPSELVESELFGYERGAFTGAFRNNPGKFEMAEGGTILLDEIGDMDFKLQAKLLQVLQDGEFLRLGAKHTTKVDARVVAATHCDLEKAIDEGRFREDLYYRLNVIRIEIPPLRERVDEIVPLAKFFIQKHSPQDVRQVDIPLSLEHVLRTHSWPGNVRQLENVMRKLVVLRRPDMVIEELKNSRRGRTVVSAAAENGTAANGSAEHSRFQDKPDRRPASLASDTAYDAGPRFLEEEDPSKDTGGPSILRQVDQARKQAEADAILTALNSTLWNRKRAAALLNVEYKALLYKMRKLGIGDKADRVEAASARA